MKDSIESLLEELRLLKQDVKGFKRFYITFWAIWFFLMVVVILLWFKFGILPIHSG